MNDITGKEIHVGDKIVFNRPGKTKLTIGTVLRLTPKGCRAEYERWGGNMGDTFVEGCECVVVGSDPV